MHLVTSKFDLAKSYHSGSREEKGEKARERERQRRHKSKRCLTWHLATSPLRSACMRETEGKGFRERAIEKERERERMTEEKQD